MLGLFSMCLKMQRDFVLNWKSFDYLHISSHLRLDDYSLDRHMLPIGVVVLQNRIYKYLIKSLMIFVDHKIEEIFMFFCYHNTLKFWPFPQDPSKVEGLVQHQNRVLKLLIVERKEQHFCRILWQRGIDEKSRLGAWTKIRICGLEFLQKCWLKS